MYKEFKVIDADAHMQEPYDLWSDFMEPEFHHRRLVVVDYENGTFIHYGPSELIPRELSVAPRVGSAAGVLQRSQSETRRSTEKPLSQVGA